MKLSQPQLPFWVGGFNGSDTWYVSDPTGTFSNFRFAQAQTTGAAANALSFSVDPTVVPGTYPLYVRVESSAGAPSVWTLVTIQVLPPALYEETYNSDGIFEEDKSGDVIVSEGTDNASFNANADPDFPLVPSTMFTAATKRTTVTKRGPAQVSYGGQGFDPLNPPAPVVNDLTSWDIYHNAGCWLVMNARNAQDDPTQGTRANAGYYQVYAYCNFLSVDGLLGLTVEKIGYNLNTGAESGHKKTSFTPFELPATEIGSYLYYRVYTWPVIPATPASGIAERQEVDFQTDFPIAGIPIPINAVGKETYYVNNYGVFYPKIQIPAKSAIASVVNQAGGYVPFPKGPFHYCPSTNPLGECQPNTLKAALLTIAKLPAPLRGWEAHHIQPIGECGSNATNNGVFLPLPSHTQFSAWFRSFTAVAGEDKTGASCETPLPLQI